jgi:alcohol dehydrogenase (cytochrome c)
MMKLQRVLFVAALVVAPVLVIAQARTPGAGPGGLDPKDILQPLGDSWLTYSGDYSGKRYSQLKQINQTNVKNLTLAWTTRVANGPNPSPARGGGPQAPVILGGVGKTQWAGGTNIRAAILSVNGVLYFSTPDNAWAVDARDGRELWHYNWSTRGGTHIGNRGLGMWGNYLYMETPDNYLISLDARTGKERWVVEIASFEEQYFSTPAPVIVDNHVLVGTGNDLDAPGFLQSFNAETGKLEWKTYMVPMNEGDPGLETWKDLDAARHGGGNPWVPGVYDPETRLYIIGTGNPSPAYISAPRGPGLDNLYTCSLVALNVDTGKMAWHYQTSPHEMHDWDSAQTPVLVDGVFNGKPRKMVMTAARNGYFFVVDRTTGEHLLTSKFSDTANWAYDKLNSKGQPVRIPEKDHHISGALVSMANQGAANWPPAAFSPDYGLFFVPVSESWAMYYLTETDPRGAMGLGGKEEIAIGGESFLKAIDYKTGKIAWRVKYPTFGGIANGILATAGRLIFSGDTSGNFVARDPANGRPLWHARLGAVSNAPSTYMLDGRQYIVVAGGDTLYAFTLYQ